MRARLLLGLLLVGSCSSEPDFGQDQCGSPKPTGCTRDLLREACEAFDGNFVTGPNGLSPRCECPTGDGGCPCARSDQCQGLCVVPNATLDTCSKETTGVCWQFVETHGCAC